MQILSLVVIFATISLSSCSPQDNIKCNAENSEEDVLTKVSLNPEHPDAKLDSPQLIRKYGYPSETHKITTEDGYILTVHRIPSGKNASTAPPGGRPIVWLQHGLLCSSSDWLYQNKDQPLAFRLADAGYDVWLGNARGNSYSKEHKYLKTNSREYWSFTWHEMGKYDLPANFDYVENVTGKSDLYYIGHSMGTTMFFVCMSLRPEYNSRIRLMSALAPSVYLANIKSTLKYAAPLLSRTDGIQKLMGMYELLPNTKLNEILGTTICNQMSHMLELCTSLIFLVVGYDTVQLNRTMLPVILGHTPSGTSTQTLSHFAQSMTVSKFREFDYGIENLARYGQLHPPDYNLSRVTAPVALYWGRNDWFADAKDVFRLAEELPNVQRVYRIPFDKFNHIDYMWAKDVVPFLYETMERFMTLY